MSSRNMNDDVGLDNGREPKLRDLEAIRTWRQVRNKIDTFLVGLSRILDARKIIHDQDFGAGDSRAGRIGDNSTDRSIGRLRERRTDEQEDKEHATNEVAQS